MRAFCEIRRVRPLLGTFVEIRLQAPSPCGLERLHLWASAGFEAIAAVDCLMSRHRADSALARLNALAPGAWMVVCPSLLRVLRASNALFRTSRGAFDVRCRGALTRIQPVVTRPSLSPPAAPVEISGNRVRKCDSLPLDLDGIAKGFAVDQAAQTMRRRARGQGLRGWVNAGGDLRRWGGPHAALSLRVADNREGSPRLQIGDTAVATSAFRKPGDGLSPATHVAMPSGVPQRTGPMVTVFAKRCLWADALTKVVLFAPAGVAERCLKKYGARALRIESNHATH